MVDDDTTSPWTTSAITRDQNTGRRRKGTKDLDGVNLEDASTPGVRGRDHGDLHVPHLICTKSFGTSCAVS